VLQYMTMSLIGNCLPVDVNHFGGNFWMVSRSAWEKSCDRGNGRRNDDSNGRSPPSQSPGSIGNSTGFHSRVSTAAYELDTIPVRRFLRCFLEAGIAIINKCPVCYIQYPIASIIRMSYMREKLIGFHDSTARSQSEWL
jgi:hypothetical protein